MHRITKNFKCRTARRKHAVAGIYFYWSTAELSDILLLMLNHFNFQQKIVPLALSLW